MATHGQGVPGANPDDGRVVRHVIDRLLRAGALGAGPAVGIRRRHGTWISGSVGNGLHRVAAAFGIIQGETGAELLGTRAGDLGLGAEDAGDARGTSIHRAELRFWFRWWARCSFWVEREW